MSDVECRKLDCKNNEGMTYEDSKGRLVGSCKLKEVSIDRDGRCENDNSN